LKSFKTTERPVLSIVIPAYNEEGSIGRVLKRIKYSVSPSLSNYEVLVIDDGSTDMTAKIANDNGAKVISQKNAGYGSALKTGLLKASGQYLCFLDADNTYPPELIITMLESAMDFSLVVGSRFTLSKNGMPIGRKIGNLIFASLVSFTTRRKTTDVWSGLRIFDRELLGIIRELPEDLTFTPLMTIKSISQGFSYTEIVIPYAERVGRSKLNSFKDGFRFLRGFTRAIATS
jgi:glycosyltransferase involved in cell wall biosynthesis